MEARCAVEILPVRRAPSLHASDDSVKTLGGDVPPIEPTSDRCGPVGVGSRSISPNDRDLERAVLRPPSNAFPRLSSRASISVQGRRFELFVAPSPTTTQLSSLEALVLALLDGTVGATEILERLRALENSDAWESVVAGVFSRHADIIEWLDRPTSRTVPITRKNPDVGKTDNSPSWQFSHVPHYSFPRFVTLLLSDRCNLRCNFCYRMAARVHGGLRSDEVFALIDECAANGAFMITFSGGEPLMDSRLAEYVSCCANQGVASLVTTNGVLLDEHVLQLLSRSVAATVQVSLISLVRETFKRITGIDAASRVANNIARAASVLPLRVRIVLSPLNCDELPRLLEFVSSAGVREVDISPVDVLPLPRARREELFVPTRRVRELVSLGEEFPNLIINWSVMARWRGTADSHACGGMINAICIQPDGSVTPCAGMQSYPYGSIRQGTIGNAWNSDALRKLRERLWIRAHAGETCATCEVFDRCLGGCHEVKCNEHLSVADPDIRCPRFPGSTIYLQESDWKETPVSSCEDRERCRR